ncbi:MAG: hypothetical protein RBT46_04565 [Weeksellaceae bacterium]|nr:hypothetical protein [Weeksellaceae bacterium]
MKRIQSYVTNPRRSEKFPVLYLGYINNEIVTYRSVFQDFFETFSKEIIPVIWISGSWTNPAYRKKGYSRIIFDEVSKDYQQHIFISNYGNMSYSLYSKRLDLINYRFLNGQRFYYRFSLAEILPTKFHGFNQIKFLLKIMDKTGNLLIDLRNIFYLKKKVLPLEISEFNEELNHFISKHNSNSLFKRNTDEFKWIFQYPWVTQKEKDDKLDEKYYFTTSAKYFYKKAYTLRKNNEIKGFLLYSIKNELMNIHYIFCESEAERLEFSKFIWNIVQKEKVSCLIMTDEKLIELMKKNKAYIYSKSWQKGFFVGKNLLEKYPEIQEKEIYMGDGDTIFT